MVSRICCCVRIQQAGTYVGIYTVMITAASDKLPQENYQLATFVQSFTGILMGYQQSQE